MVSLSERDAVTQQAKDDVEMRAMYAFLFGASFDYCSETAFPHSDLLRAVVRADVDAFKLEVANYQKRRTSEGSSWYENDSLIFLLLVGCEKFEVAMGFLEPILSARERNTNPIPKQVNEVFRAVLRKNHGMESPLGFIKLPLLNLAGRLELSSEAARKVYGELTFPGTFTQLTPFLQLLALRAFDLVLLERRPHPIENFDALVKALETYKEHASLGQACKLLWALPYKWILGTLSTVAMIITFVFGLGQRVPSGTPPRGLPVGLQMVSFDDAMIHKMPVVNALAGQFLSNRPENETWLALAIQTSSLGAAAGKFSVEVSTSAGTMLGAQTWLVHPTESGSIPALLPNQHSEKWVRTFAESGEANDHLIIVLYVQPSQSTTIAQLASTIVLRTLN
ncbi:MAG: hypothetical protein IPK32_04275 [Verrucomicrobiaceae bacterium]|nr:hypothetical protein [Verrucomicrobiaceae bacterium]